mmetsp:Transcript_35239/g.97514  ORF Transcript_35239/g.97514 Transcript_35239/m.97514 type:complete len:301 (-) Transcript_35239:204-1106(-)
MPSTRSSPSPAATCAPPSSSRTGCCSRRPTCRRSLTRRWTPETMRRPLTARARCGASSSASSPPRSPTPPRWLTRRSTHCSSSSAPSSTPPHVGASVRTAMCLVHGPLPMLDPTDVWAEPHAPPTLASALLLLALGLDPGSSELQRMHRPPWLLPCCPWRCGPLIGPLLWQPRRPHLVLLRRDDCAGRRRHRIHGGAARAALAHGQAAVASGARPPRRRRLRARAARGTAALPRDGLHDLRQDGLDRLPHPARHRRRHSPRRRRQRGAAAAAGGTTGHRMRGQHARARRSLQLDSGRALR